MSTANPAVTRLPGGLGKFFLLFISMLAALLVYPYAEASQAGYYVLRVFGAATILASLYTANFRRTGLVLAMMLAVPALYLRVVVPHVNANEISVLSLVGGFAFDVMVTVMIFRRVYTRGQADAETVFGALCIYLVTGFGFASLYGVAVNLQTHAFYLDPLLNQHALPNRFDLVYYSFATLTSLGAAGIFPVSGQVRALSVLEAIMGVLYLAVLVAKLIGRFHAQKAL